MSSPDVSGLSDVTPPRLRPLGWPFGAVLVVFAAAIVLVAEIVAVRVIAPYVGITLETFSAVIGCVLAGISLGSWIGGMLADRLQARTVLMTSLALGGVSLIASPYIARVIGPNVSPSKPLSALLLAGGSFLLPCTALSAVTPTVLKAIGQGSGHLGSVAGAISAIGTGGALLGNFGAGFILVGTLRSAQILVACGAVCLVLAAVTALVLGTPGAVRMSAAFVFLVGGAGGSQLGEQLPCDAETKYVCLNIDRQGDRYLIQSNIYSQSLTNVANPRDLRFEYVRDMAVVVATATGTKKSGLGFGYVGGGGYTLPLYFEATYPQSSHVVYEIDEEMVERVTTVLGIENRSTRFPTRIGDARPEIMTSAPDSADVIIGDAFSGITVPWHLTTTEFLKSITDMLRDKGLYIMNLIDFDHHDFARAEARTFRSVFGEVAVLAPPLVFSDSDDAGANIVLVGGDDLPDVAELNSALRRFASESVAIMGADLDAFIGDAIVLTDDFAPADQLIGRP